MLEDEEAQTKREEAHRECTWIGDGEMKGKKRKSPADYDGLGPNDVDFGFSVGDYDGEVEL